MDISEIHLYNIFYLSSKHSSIWRSLITICFNFHSTSNSRNGFPAEKYINFYVRNIQLFTKFKNFSLNIPSRKIGYMNESIVKARKNVSNAKNNFTFTKLWSKRYLDLFLLYLSSFWRHFYIKYYISL